MILKFPDVEKRSAFLDTVRSGRPELLASMRVSRLLPHIRVTDVTNNDVSWIMTRVSAFGKAYENFKLEKMRGMSPM